MEGLQEDLWLKNPTQDDSYWIGFYGNGFDNYEGQKRTSKTTPSINSRGELGLEPGGNDGCPDDTKIKIDNIGNDKNGYYGAFVFTGDKTARVDMAKFEKTDSNAEKGFLCEKERDWTCPDGYTIFQEVCYMFHPDNVTLGSADEECWKAGGRVAQVDDDDDDYDDGLQANSHLLYYHQLTMTMTMTMLPRWTPCFTEPSSMPGCNNTITAQSGWVTEDTQQQLLRRKTIFMFHFLVENLAMVDWMWLTSKLMQGLLVWPRMIAW